MAGQKLQTVQRESRSANSMSSHPRRPSRLMSPPAASQPRSSTQATSHPSSSLQLRSQWTTPSASSPPRSSMQASSQLPSSSQSTTPSAGSPPRSSTQASSQPPTSPSARSHRRSYNLDDFSLWIVRGGRFRKERKVSYEGRYVRITTPAGRSQLFLSGGIASANVRSQPTSQLTSSQPRRSPEIASQPLSSQQRSSLSVRSKEQNYKPKDLSLWVVRGGRFRKVSLGGKRLARCSKTKCEGKPQPFDTE